MAKIRIVLYLELYNPSSPSLVIALPSTERFGCRLHLGLAKLPWRCPSTPSDFPVRRTARQPNPSPAPLQVLPVLGLDTEPALTRSCGEDEGGMILRDVRDQLQEWARNCTTTLNSIKT